MARGQLGEEPAPLLKQAWERKRFAGKRETGSKSPTITHYTAETPEPPPAARPS